MAALVTDSGRKTPARFASSAILACQSDERLVRLARSGHERAFEAIVHRYRGVLVRYCRRILPESRCEDAVQQALLNAHGALLASDDAVQLKPWLFAITRNAALNMLRQNGWNYEQIPADFDGVPQPDEVYEEHAQLERTVAALNELPERQRDALVMREFEGRSYDEIALALGANDGAVRQLLNRARVTLRSAAAALIPPPLVLRAAAAMPPGDGRRAAEILGGLGAAGIAKAGATALVAGTLVVGVVDAPLSIDGPKKTTRESAALGNGTSHGAGRAGASAQGKDTPVSLRTGQRGPDSHPGTSSGSRSTRHGSGGDREQSGSSHSGPGRSGSRDSDDGGSGDTRSGGGERESSGSDRNGSGSGDSMSNETEHSGSRSGTSGGSGSGTSGGSGSDDVASVQADGISDRTETSSSSGSSGSGDGGSAAVISSPTSGSGSTSSGSGSSGSGSSGSASSGSGSSGSGSSSGSSQDPLDH